MTTNINAIKKGIVNGQGFMQIAVKVNHATFPINQGDLVYLNAGIGKVVTSDANALTLVGVALQPSSVSSSLDNPSAPLEKTVQCGFACAATFKTTPSETYTDGVKVYAGADAQTITTVAGTSAVGVIKLESLNTSVTGATGVSVQIIVFSRAFGKFEA